MRARTRGRLPGSAAWPLSAPSTAPAGQRRRGAPRSPPAGGAHAPRAQRGTRLAASWPRTAQRQAGWAAVARQTARAAARAAPLQAAGRSWWRGAARLSELGEPRLGWAASGAGVEQEGPGATVRTDQGPRADERGLCLGQACSAEPALRQRCTRHGCMPCVSDGRRPAATVWTLVRLTGHSRMGWFVHESGWLSKQCCTAGGLAIWPRGWQAVG